MTPGLVLAGVLTARAIARSTRLLSGEASSRAAEQVCRRGGNITWATSALIGGGNAFVPSVLAVNRNPGTWSARTLTASCMKIGETAVVTSRRGNQRIPIAKVARASGNPWRTEFLVRRRPAIRESALSHRFPVRDAKRFSYTTARPEPRYAAQTSDN